MKAFILKYKAAIIAAVLIAAVLTVAFLSGGKIGEDKAKATFDSATSDQATKDQATDQVTTIQPTTVLSTTESATVAPTTSHQNSKQKTKNDQSSRDVTDKNQAESPEQHKQNSTQPATDKYKTDPIPEGKPKPVEPQQQTTEDNRIYCTFSISCSTILDNKDKMSPEIADIVPSDGWILKPQKVEITDGESVFDVLTRVCKDKKIHMEYSWTPIYNSAYIEGIANIYEFDCGDLSGWMYKVNDWYPNYGCSRYVIKNGDTVEWNYTCSSGRDLGKEY